MTPQERSHYTTFKKGLVAFLSSFVCEHLNFYFSRAVRRLTAFFFGYLTSRHCARIVLLLYTGLPNIVLLFL